MPTAASPSASTAERTADPTGAPVRIVADRLAERYGAPRTELGHTTAFELLVATALSAQTTDARVNSVTPELFGRWPDAAALGSADAAAVEQVIRPVGMAPTKSRRIIALAQRLQAEHNGQVPDDQDALEALPGVGRKTALVVRGVWHGADAFAVDTHVGRLARRLGWTGAKDPRRVEEDVIARVRTAGAPVIGLTALSLRLILHGRAICHARSPECSACLLADVCPSSAAGSTGAAGAAA